MESKFYCVMGLFDSKTNRVFKNLKESLKEKGYQGDNLPPHLTIGAYVGLNEKKLLLWADEFSKRFETMDINFNHIGVFGTNICYVAPRADKKLLEFHEKFHVKYDDFCGEIGYNYSLKSNNWVPHATIAMGEPEVIKPLIPDLCEKFKPFKGKLTQITICEFYPMREIGTYDLKGYYQKAFKIAE
jgi:2'-5' RNA ligase